MLFSDELYLVKEERKQNDLKQYETVRTETKVFCDLNSVTGNEQMNEGGSDRMVQQAQAVVHMEDYRGEKVARYAGGNYWMPAGFYDVYRTYVNGDTIELYLIQREGVR